MSSYLNTQARKKKMAQLMALAAMLPSHSSVIAQVQWTMDGVAEVIDFNRHPNNTPDKNFLNNQTFKSQFETLATDPFGDGSDTQEIRFDLKSTQ